MARQADLLAVEEAQERILSRFRRLDSETVALEQTLGRVLARALEAERNVPPFANSSMDGFALRSEDTREAAGNHPAILRITAHIAAGSPSQAPIRSGECARIMTGAPLPPGADTVIPFEEVEEREHEIRISAPIRLGACVRPAGNDIRAGASLLPAGTEVGAPEIALLATLGCGQVAVTRKPLVAVLSTGDELVAPGRPLGPGQIYNSNTPMLTAAVTLAGAQPLPIDTAGDDPDVIAEAIGKAGDADLLITSGGASVGDFDHVKDVVGGAGELTFWRVRLRPGKPLLFGSVGDLPVIGLPGNPTSAMVTFEEFVRPAIRTMLGASPLRPELRATLDEDIDNRGGRRTYARVRLQYQSGRFHASLAGGQDSAMVLPLAQADGLLVVPEDRDRMVAGEEATVQVWRLPAQSN